jgi:hypothetical protein
LKDTNKSSQGSKALWIVIVVLVIMLFCCRCDIYFTRPVYISPDIRSNAGDNVTSYTLYAKYSFGAGEEYQNSLEAAEAAKDELGNRRAHLICDDLSWESNLDDMIEKLKSDLLCVDNGYLEILPPE